MSRARWFCGCLFSLMLGALPNCGGGGGAEDCDAGQEGCECLVGQCFGALLCLSDICVDPVGSGNASQVATGDPPDPTADPATSADTSADPTAEPTSEPTDDPSTDPTDDPSTAPTTTPDETTGPPVDDSTTTDATTGPPPDDSTTTTGEPKENDPQPAAGMYSDCFEQECQVPPTDGCFTIKSPQQVVLDGICSVFCRSDDECLPAPYSQAVPNCQAYTPTISACVLLCVESDAECPTGMSCRDVNLNGQLVAICT